MDLLSILQAIWRHKFAAIPVILFTALGALYVLAVKPPVYDASSSLLLVNPPPPPTEAQIAADPKLAKVNANNPYDTLGDLWTADAVVSSVASDWPQAQVGLSANPDNPPIIQITGSGSTPQAAVQAAETVTHAAATDLYLMQKSQGVLNHYMLKAVELVQPQAKLSVGGKLRSLIAVLGIGLILLFVVISAAQAMERLRMDGSIRPGRPAWARLRKTAAPDGDAAWALGSGVPGSGAWGDDATGATPGTAPARSGRQTPGDYAGLRARARFCPAPALVAAHWRRRIQRWRNRRGEPWRLPSSRRATVTTGRSSSRCTSPCFPIPGSL
jgi:capsular polysaccharide biosynthesis protein